MMKRILIGTVGLLLPWSAAFAQDAPDDSSGKDRRVRVGLGAQVRPEYIGADDTEVAPLWDIDIARGDNPFKFEAPDDKFGIAVISKNGFSLGPAANIESSRKESDVGAPVGKVKTTFEAGAFAQYELSDSFRVRGEVLKGLGGHDGVVGTLGADWISRDADRYVFSIGPRVLFSDGRYQRAYFGVTPEVALATGLPAYRPDAGIHAVALASGLSYQFNNRFGMFGFGRYERLVGDAAKSPIVREFGSRNQWSAGAGLTYTFNIRL
ncbi:MAG: MipA/OmpV family protein [Sphingomicrobium sp.]